MSEADRAQRAEARRKNAVLHRTRLERTETDLHPISGKEAVALVAQLTRESWSEAKLPMPTYARSEIPIQFVSQRHR